MSRLVRPGLLLGIAVLLTSPTRAEPVFELRVGSKKFTESVVLGELGAHLLRAEGFRVVHRRELGGTRVLWSALRRGDLDFYPDYTGTLSEEILGGRVPPEPAALRAALAELGIGMSRPLGFDNTYALGVPEARAQQLGLTRISDLGRHPELRLGFSDEFMDRRDGWPGLRAHYGLPHRNVRGLDHDLAYRGIESGTLDVIDLYATDADVHYYELRVLEDDLDFFPRYEAVWLWRAELEPEASGAIRAIRRLEGVLDAPTMIRLNVRAKLDRVPEVRVAADFLAARFGLELEVRRPDVLERLARHTGEHLFLVGVSLGAAVVLAIPLGILAAHRPRVGQIVLAATGVVQTVPSLALLVFMIPLLGIGSAPAIAALFLYSLLPIVRNTHAGLVDIPEPLRESAEALGLGRGAILRRVELPLASRAILAGIKTSAVINVGTATLGALIGAGGYGQPILTGIRLDDLGLILQGAVPAATLALAVQGGFDLLERVIVPRGLRLTRES